MPKKNRHLQKILGCVTLISFLTLSFYTSFSSNRSELIIFASENRSAYFNVLEQIHDQTCVPINHILFLKIHKCASSTLQSTFLRYGYKNNLSFALPSNGNYLGNPQLFTAKDIPKDLQTPSGKFDIFAVHSRLNENEHRKVIYDDAKWITVIRDPILLYESVFNYFKLQFAYGFKFREIHRKSMMILLNLPRHNGRYGRNQMLFDLGYPENISLTEVRQVTQRLDSLFDLVIVSEFMDEGLILMRHMLCWSLNDIIVFTKNARREELKDEMDDKTRKIVHDLNLADTALYEYFLEKFKTKISNFGVKRMAQEVAELRALRHEQYKSCIARKVNGKDDSLLFKEYSGLVNAYILSNTSNAECYMMSIPELPFIDIIRNRQKYTLNNIL